MEDKKYYVIYTHGDFELGRVEIKDYNSASEACKILYENTITEEDEVVTMQIEIWKDGERIT